MGAIAEMMMMYAQPLLDETDGSVDQMNHALALGQFCWNLSLIPEEERNEALDKMMPSLEMEADEFEAFRSTFAGPMIQRHQEMFPGMHGAGSMGLSNEVSAPAQRAIPAVSRERYPGTGRNAACPCNSGRKYKKCCGG